MAVPRGLPDCGGPLLDTSTGPELLILACPGCGYAITWHATDDNATTPHDPAGTDPLEAE